MNSTESVSEPSGFPQTAWTIILTAKDRNSAEYKEKMQYLISLYWKPIYLHIRRFWSKSGEEAKDLTQEFFKCFLEKNYLDEVAPENGRFRTFIRAVLKNFLMNMKRKEQSIKRGRDMIVINIDDVEEDNLNESQLADPTELFDIDWAKSVLSRSFETLKNRLNREGKSRYFEIFNKYYFDKSSHELKTRQDVGEQFGLKETDVTNYLRYARKLLKGIIRKEISEYVLDNNEIEDELKYLLSLWIEK
ncbi:MAG: sigma-70 family RNA polymerase sigma factor [Planctomycetes bacterium]|nr:sigma-70 family RNA polymerase sigma factor [Planctomycetota bacterium]